MQWRRRILIGLLAAAVLAGLAYGFIPRPALVDTAPVRRAPMEVTVEEEGKTRVIDRYVVSTPVAGYLRRLEWSVGDAVHKGQPLAALEPLRSAVLDPRSRAEAEARVAAATSALRVAQENARGAAAEAQLARTEYQRRKRLCEVACVSREELDQAATQMRSTEAASRSAAFGVDVAEADLEAARTALKYSAAGETADAPETVAVRSPVDGRVLTVVRKSEGVASAGESLLEVGNPRALEITVEVLSADAVQILPGMSVRFQRWGGADDLEGTVRTVEPTGFTKVSALGVEEQRVVVVADLTSPAAAWERLGDGYRVDAVFLLWQGADVLQVPASALFRAGGGWAAFAIEDGRAVRRSVEVGHQNGLSAEVRGGLAAGDIVIIHPDEAIAAGSRVRPRSQHDS